MHLARASLLVSMVCAVAACSAGHPHPPPLGDVEPVAPSGDGGTGTPATGTLPGGGTSGGGTGGGTGSGNGGTPAGSCLPGISGSCCYAPDKDGITNGSPACRWKRLTNGEHTTISVRKVDSNGKPSGPFQPVDMVAIVPDHIPAQSDCGMSPAGFVLSVAGGGGSSPTNGIADYSILDSGEWRGEDSGAGIVSATVDPAVDSGTANAHLNAAIYACSGLFRANAVASANVMSSVEYTTPAGSFQAEFAADAKERGDNSPTAYYVVFVK